jgi:hypothetical protein
MDIEAYYFGPGYGLPSVSPFCCKLDLYFQAAKISTNHWRLNRWSWNVPLIHSLPLFFVSIAFSYLLLPLPEYDTKHLIGAGKSPTKTLPCIRSSENKYVGDSAAIIEMMKTQGYNLDGNLSESDRAVMLCLQRLIENHLVIPFMYMRWLTKEGNKAMGTNVLAKFPAPIKFVACRKMAGITKTRMKHGGIGGTQEQMFSLLQEDVLAIAAILGENEFMFGQSSVTSADCIVWGMLCQIYYDTGFIELKIAAWMQQATPKLCQYLDRLKTMYYSVPMEEIPDPSAETKADA